MENKIDYKELLIKYMKHVCDCEGITFVDKINYKVQFSDEDKKELENIEKEVDSLYRQDRMKAYDTQKDGKT